MEKSYIVKVRGVSFENEDGTSRQDLIAKCRRNDSLILRAEPDNPHDRNAVAVLNDAGAQLGWLKSDARDATSILRGEPVSARVEKVIGGTRWWHRLLRKKRYFGLLIRLTKGEIDWVAHNEYRDIAEKVDRLVDGALASEKSSQVEVAIAKYQKALKSIVELNKDNPIAAAHRRNEAPINRLTILLVRQKRRNDALAEYHRWESVRDPISLTKASREALFKRVEKLKKQSESKK